MTDPHEIIEDALADAYDIGMTDALCAKAVVLALEAAGIKLLSAEGVTEEMLNAAAECHEYYPFSSTVKIPADEEEIWRAMLSAAPLFGKGSEK